jgi:hypothetical protein
MKSLAFDLCCGRGGWARGLLASGFDVIGFDIIERHQDFPAAARYIRCDVRAFDFSAFRPALVVASPPCEEFSRFEMPWTRRRNPPAPDLSIVAACRRAAAVCRCPLILENVRCAQNWLGRAAWHYGPFYLWGDVPALMPHVPVLRQKQSRSSSARLERAEIPAGLAEHIGRVFAAGDKAGL